MRASQTPRVVKSMKKQPFKGRGQIYKWLRKWHRVLVDTFEETEAGWAVVVDDMIRDGVVGSRGHPPNPKSAAKVWARVGRDIAEAERRKLTGTSTKKVVSRAAPGWQPPVASAALPLQTATAVQPARPIQNEPGPFAPTAHSTGSADPSRMTPAERKADLRRVIDRRSGR